MRNQQIKRSLQVIWPVRFVAVVLGAAILAVAVGPASAADEGADPIDAVREALDAWAEFASTGDLLALGSSFVRGGPQYQQLVAESAGGRKSQSGAAFHFDVRDLELRLLDAATATVWVEFEATREGFVSETFGWDFDLIQDRGSWRVWTVVPAVEPSESAQLSAVDPATTTSTTPTTLASTAAISDPANEIVAAKSSLGPERGTRIPAMSAWVVVVTVVGVAVAGYMAPRIERRREG